MMRAIRYKPTMLPRLRFRHGAALYVLVFSTTLIVSLLGLAGIAIVRIERLQAGVVDDMLRARTNARSAVELALRVIANDPNWRTTYANGVETTAQTLGANGRGTVSWTITDSDGNLTDLDTNLFIHGIGRVGDAVQVSCLKVETVSSAPAQLRDYDNLLNILNLKNEKPDDKKSFGQYLKVSLPADAVGWKITSFQFFGKKENSNRTLKARIYEPLGSKLPSSTVIDAVDVNSDSFTLSSGWQTITFSGDYLLEPDQGVCIALESSEIQPPIRFDYYDGGVAEANSGFLSGDPGWDTFATNKAMRYRVFGVYVTAEGELKPIMGTWQRQASPDP